MPGKKVLNPFQRVNYWHCSVMQGWDV